MKTLIHNKKIYTYSERISDGLFEKMQHVQFDGTIYTLNEIRKLPNVFLDPFMQPDGKFIFCLIGKPSDYKEGYKEKLNLTIEASINTHYKMFNFDPLIKKKLIVKSAQEFKPWYYIIDKVKLKAK